MSDSGKEILKRLQEKETQYSLPKGILNLIYDEERQVLYKGRKRNMDEKIFRIINQRADELDYTKLKEVLDLDDNTENWIRKL